MIRWAGEKILGFLDDADMVKGPGTAFWRRAFLLPRRSRRRRAGLLDACTALSACSSDSGVR